MQKRCFHSSIVSLGRKTGASAFVAESRALSKKQTKRKRILVKARAANVDQQQKKTKSTFMKNQMASMDMQQFIKDTTAQLKGVFQDLLLPDGTARRDTDDIEPQRNYVRHDPMLILYSLRNNKAKQDLLRCDVSAQNPLLLSESNGLDSSIGTSVGVLASRSGSSGELLDKDIRDAVMPEDEAIMTSVVRLARRGKFAELSEVCIYQCEALLILFNTHCFSMLHFVIELLYIDLDC